VRSRARYTDSVQQATDVYCMTTQKAANEVMTFLGFELQPDPSAFELFKEWGERLHELGKAGKITFVKATNGGGALPGDVRRSPRRPRRRAGWAGEAQGGQAEWGEASLHCVIAVTGRLFARTTELHFSTCPTMLPSDFPAHGSSFGSQWRSGGRNRAAVSALLAGLSDHSISVSRGWAHDQIDMGDCGLISTRADCSAMASRAALPALLPVYPSGCV